MNIAYLILAHKNPPQLARLINTLSTSDSSFFIHVDKKSGKTFELETLELVYQKPRVHFISQQAVHLGHFSLVDATVKLMFALLESKVHFDYVRLLSGQCYPIKPTLEIHRYLENNYPHSFMEFFSLPSQIWNTGGEKCGGMSRINYFYLYFAGRFLRLPFKRQFKRQFPKMQPFGGSHFWFLTRECLEYICRFYNRNPQFLSFFKYVYIPEEIFFQTVLLNSHLKDKVINNILLHTEWDYNAPHPTTFGKSHFQVLSESSCLFARKFDSYQDNEVLDLIDQKLLS